MTSSTASSTRSCPPCSLISICPASSPSARWYPRARFRRVHRPRASLHSPAGGHVHSPSSGGGARRRRRRSPASVTSAAPAAPAAPAPQRRCMRRGPMVRPPLHRPPPRRTMTRTRRRTKATAMWSWMRKRRMERRRRRRRQTPTMSLRTDRGGGTANGAQEKARMRAERSARTGPMSHTISWRRCVCDTRPAYTAHCRCRLASWSDWRAARSSPGR
mmetsp:Transcript_18005/g.54124  ORF Transcript_18005/g.54124 Transcript_18005/m.54124 type:complete len:217 (+) Transcript_18005:522-1172(+)